MAFAYYNRLTRAQQRIYRRSDEVKVVRLPAPAKLRALVEDLAAALASEDLSRTQAVADGLLAGLAAQLRVPPLRAEVLAARPSRSWGELHGLYTPGERGRAARATVWMRTAQRRQVVAFRTFLRTLLHELCHHLDYQLLGLPDSFHTEGFYQRESGLLHQLVDGAASSRRRPTGPPAAPPSAAGPRTA